MGKKRFLKGELPVPYIVAIVIAIIVIALLVIFFFLYFNKSQTQANETVCIGKEINYCTQWAATGYNPDSMPNKQIFSQWAPDCSSYSWAGQVGMKQCKCVLNPTDPSCQTS